MGVFTNLDDYTEITVEEAWILLNDTSNGIQIPIDVRTDVEWANEHIDTPSPENPKHHCVCEWDNETIVQEFMSLYAGKTIILYCLSGGRSTTAANILVDGGFTGTIYNMLGGITAWKNAGFPTICNQPPDTPTITGTTNGKPETEYPYTISSTDPEGDDVHYYINWSDGTDTMYIGPYSSGEEVIVNHIWTEKGAYVVKVKTWDYYRAESDWGTLEVSVPKNKVININSLFLRFLENHPHLFPLIRQIFELQ
jgi:rhodanese-related sulfurtransferase